MMIWYIAQTKKNLCFTNKTKRGNGGAYEGCTPPMKDVSETISMRHAIVLDMEYFRKIITGDRACAGHHETHTLHLKITLRKIQPT